ncbi:hypothetical protein LEP1GSC068_1962 [Leptospira sp. Fiocruz LV3954]|uniref:Uncharacterized protein n=2 Tax=Leptospira santarosai TaxID=28183 RepID=A0AB73MPA5_9LEPT|nr:hypothetical protein B2G51_02660 [Leptospira santarosai]EKO79783.1 hypothetical protein LEP1GSC068_1962 [Leptospira sp. Fiocruz LV3954]EMI69357.1 hypothetical protein LEP1GSC076_2016 [Leptospira sp. Fiocruz LV4135]EMN20722.1 hypothetical protein LEP1GSC063_3128 [Leptospira santarosai serovar Arenal str. MAVJ 401]OLY63833.1 hypothetical protein BWD11_12605 [Leptospira santarosai serovar Grippotyphosa]ONF79019.1 hypothetical protein BWD12_09865 [Leptospira santarosai serovar Bananal]
MLYFADPDHPSIVLPTRTNGEYPGHSKNLNYIVSYFFEEYIRNHLKNTLALFKMSVRLF